MNTLVIFLLIFCGINILVTIALIYVVIRLNKYIGTLEETTDGYTDRVDNLQDSMQLALKENLFKDGTLKKPLVSADDFS